MLHSTTLWKRRPQHKCQRNGRAQWFAVELRRFEFPFLYGADGWRSKWRDSADYHDVFDLPHLIDAHPEYDSPTGDAVDGILRESDSHNAYRLRPRGIRVRRFLLRKRGQGNIRGRDGSGIERDGESCARSYRFPFRWSRIELPAFYGVDCYFRERLDFANRLHIFDLAFFADDQLQHHSADGDAPDGIGDIGRRNYLRGLKGETGTAFSRLLRRENSAKRKSAATLIQRSRLKLCVPSTSPPSGRL